jgi:hypothetical protein
VAVPADYTRYMNQVCIYMRKVGEAVKDGQPIAAEAQTLRMALAALDASAALIVLGSPDAAKSPYVNEEVRLFKYRHPDRPIIPIILGGKPGDLAAECFPPGLKFSRGAPSDQLASTNCVCHIGGQWRLWSRG